MVQDFIFDDSKIKNELAAISNVTEQYLKPLVYGIVKKSPEEEAVSIRERLKKAGSEIVIAEMQSQIDPFLAAKTK
ncbi:DUF3502 domain-containing protein [Paenibacillus psychroresistens]|uniref:DUF3502 domain-containing protein n=1 Tax=Paenibacillus psychroresistens TaxID=1778678 RepID=UPI001390CC92|nr:DUF3502 domain-containing protein [Paenibacillus psychroresistens]